MENKKYYANTRIHTTKRIHTGKWTNYTDALPLEERVVLNAACRYKLAKRGNDAPRGGKQGNFIEILKFFTTNSILKRMEIEKEEEMKKISKVIVAEKIDSFEIISDFGSIIIDGVAYSNFLGKGATCADVFKCNFEEFKNAELITRRQVYNPNDPITIIKFDAPKAISVKISDIDDEFGTREIENACGFVIWAKKLKIFVAE